MDIAYFAYLLFVIPGFILVWSYRHFTRAAEIGDFEYAAWSFIWGTFIFLLYGLCIKLNDILGIESSSVVFDLNNPFSLFGTALGVGITLSAAVAFPFGFIGAFISKRGLFQSIDRMFFKMLD